MGGIFGAVIAAAGWFSIMNTRILHHASRRKILVGLGGILGGTGVSAAIIFLSPLYRRIGLSRKVTRRSFLIGSGGAIAGAVIAAVVWSRRSQVSTNPGIIPYETRPLVKLESLSALDDRGPFDVCIIGSGPAGSVLAQDLVGHGVNTVILESGPAPDLRYSSGSFDQLEAYRSSGSINYPVASTRFRALGGTSNLWGGRIPRLHAIDFETNSYAPEDAAWPITYSELEPYYQRAERTLRAHGGALSQYQPSRDHDLPFSLNTANPPLKALMNTAGITVDDVVRSISTDGEDPIRIWRDILPNLSVSQYATLISGATVTQLIADTSGNILGAKTQSLEGETRIVRAQIYVVACGALETSRLLLLSRSETFPNGIGNSYDLVGRYFMEHPVARFWGTLPHGHLTKNVSSHQFYEQLKREGFGSAIFVFKRIEQQGQSRLDTKVFMEMQPLRTNRITLSHNVRDYFGNAGVDVSLGFTELDRKGIERVRSLVREIYADLRAQDVLERGLVWGHHHLGSCRMGDNPETSVVDRNLLVHESPNLYLSGSATFVTGGASNPTLTIVALSHRLADRLYKRLNKKAKTPLVMETRTPG